MEALVGIVKTALIPGSIAFLVQGLVVGVLLLYRPDPWRGWGRRWLAILAVSYCVLSVPAGADLVAAALVGSFRPIASASDARGATAVVVLDGGTTRVRARGDGIDSINLTSALRALEAVRVYRLLGNPLVVVTSGDLAAQDPRSQEGAAIRAAIVVAGVPADRVILDTMSPNTRSHATTVRALLKQRGIDRIVLVTAATHIRRAVLVCQAVGFDVIASPAVARSEEPAAASRWRRWWPSTEALRLSEDGIRDVIAIAYYWLRGWLAPA
jgi:uncharacterized SAM-binding protein YcdF (DUF218 family)